MSIYVDGALCATVGRGLTLTSSMSSRFFETNFPGRDPRHLFQITLMTSTRGTFSTALACTIDPLLSVDLVLGLRWKAYVREWLLAFGELVPSSFDPWSAFLGTGTTLAFLGSGEFTARVSYPPCLPCL
jgi:hypothetical protein